MSSTSTALALSTKVLKSTKPPLKKSEIIHALALRKHQQAITAAEDYNGRLADLEARIDAKVVELSAIGGTPSHRWDTKHMEQYSFRPLGHKYSQAVYNRQSLQLTLSRTIMVQDLPAGLRQLVNEFNKLNLQRKDFVVPDFRDIKARVRDQVEGQNSEPASRVAALLKDPATVKVLDKTLAELDRKPAAIAA